MAKIQFIIDTNTGEVSKQMSALGKNTKNTTKQMTGMSKVSKGLSSSLGRVGVALGVAGVGRGIIQGFSDATANAFKFSQEMTSLLSLGNNVKNFKEVTNAVQELSVQTGIGTGEIADGMFNLQSATSNLSDEIRDNLLKESIELSKVTGVALPDSISALVKTWQIYGDELEDVNQLQNKLFNTSRDGVLTFGDIARLMPDVSSAAKAMGITFDEVAASIVTATQKGGRTEVTFTGLKGVFLKLSEAQKKGIKLTGTFGDKLKQLSEVDGVKLKEIFGAEGIAVINNLVTGVDDYNKALEKTKNIQGDLTAETLAFRRANDEVFKQQEKQQQLDRFFEQKNRDLSQGAAVIGLKTVASLVKQNALAMLSLNPSAIVGVDDINKLGRSTDAANSGRQALSTGSTLDDRGAAESIRQGVESGSLNNSAELKQVFGDLIKSIGEQKALSLGLIRAVNDISGNQVKTVINLNKTAQKTKQTKGLNF